MAEFYLEAGQVQQASAFLLDSLKTFQVTISLAKPKLFRIKLSVADPDGKKSATM